MEGLTENHYGVILADPAHKFETWGEDGHGKSPERHYETMTVEEICDLPVAKYAGKNSALFLWMTWPKIFDAERIMRAWGFRYSGLAWEWIKYNPVTQKYAFGGGYGTRKNLEPCLLGRRGSPQILNRSTRDFMFAPRREHSRKPDEQYDRIEKMFHGPYAELFARQSRPGWDTWGNEKTKFDQADELVLEAA